MFLKSLARSGFGPLMCDFAHFASSLLIRGLVCLGSTMPLFGEAGVESVSTFSVIGKATLGFLPFIRSFARSGLFLFIFGFSEMGLLPFSRGPA